MTLTEEIKKLIPRYRAYARSIASNTAEADDLVSEVTLKMLDRSQDFDFSDTNLVAYGIRSIRNLLIDQRRLSFNTHESIDDENFNLDEAFLGAGFVQNSPESSCLMDDILEKMRSLGKDCQAVMQLFFIHGCSYQEIAEQLSWEPSTVGTRLLRCKRNFVALAEDLR